MAPFLPVVPGHQRQPGDKTTCPIQPIILRKTYRKLIISDIYFAGNYACLSYYSEAFLSAGIANKGMVV